MLEADLRKKVMAYLKSLPGGFFWINHQGPFAATRGVSDILGVYHGRFFAIELKSPTGKHPVTKLQRIFLDRVIKAGEIGIVARSVEEIKDLINGLDSTQSSTSISRTRMVVCSGSSPKQTTQVGGRQDTLYKVEGISNKAPDKRRNKRLVEKIP